MQAMAAVIASTLIDYSRMLLNMAQSFVAGFSHLRI